MILADAKVRQIIREELDTMIQRGQAPISENDDFDKLVMSDSEVEDWEDDYAGSIAQDLLRMIRKDGQLIVKDIQLLNDIAKIDVEAAGIIFTISVELTAFEDDELAEH
jgi:F420-dependent methylenetetrahydromethanopterin dehydrogenase